MKIYRLQYTNGAGCYTYNEFTKGDWHPESSYFWNKLTHLHGSCKEHPGFLFDKGFDSDAKKYFNLFTYYFGCNSIEQFKKWFDDEELVELIQTVNELEIVEIEIDDEYVHSSEKQCIFRKNKVISETRINKKQIFMGEIVYV